MQSRLSQISEKALGARGVELGPCELATLRRLVRDRGEREAAALAGISRNALARALGGLSVQRGTVRLIGDALAVMAAELDEGAPRGSQPAAAHPSAAGSGASTGPREASNG